MSDKGLYVEKCLACRSNSRTRPCIDHLLKSISAVPHMVPVLVSEAMAGSLGAYERLIRADLWQHVLPGSIHHRKVLFAHDEHAREWEITLPVPMPGPAAPEAPSAFLHPTAPKSTLKNTTVEVARADVGGRDFQPGTGPQFKQLAVEPPVPTTQPTNPTMPSHNSTADLTTSILDHFGLETHPNISKFVEDVTADVRDLYAVMHGTDLLTRIAAKADYSKDRPSKRQASFKYATVRINGLKSYLDPADFRTPATTVDLVALSQVCCYGKPEWQPFMFQWIAPEANPAMILIASKAAQHLDRQLQYFDLPLKRAYP